MITPQKKSDRKRYYTNKAFMLSFITSFCFLVGSIFINFYAGLYAAESASNPVRDLILSNIPVFAVDDIFVYGPVLLWIFVGIICLRNPNTIPFVLKSIALFVVIRSVFITLTHIGPFPDSIQITDGVALIRKFTFGGDLFFSAHTGLPFLMALIFWENKRLRFFFIASAIFFGCIVLMGHLHYSIDVLAAFFITYTIFHLALHFFKKEYDLFRNGLSS